MAEITAHQVADYFIAFSRDVGDPLTNLKLQKLLYYAQGWYLALYDKPLFPDRIEAWPHGPVVPPVYGRFKRWRWDAIGDEIGPPDLPEDVRAHLEEVIRVFGGFTAFALEQMTHQEDPWKDARGDIPLDAPSNAVIQHDSLARFFKRVAAESSEDKTDHH
jgi:uncharacterized phage-associated protein